MRDENTAHKTMGMPVEDEGVTDSQAPASRSSLAWVAVLALVLLVAYPLALGPLIYLDQLGRLPSIAKNAARIAYWPLAWLGTRNDDANAVLTGYTVWWSVLRETRHQDSRMNFDFWMALEYEAQGGQHVTY